MTQLRMDFLARTIVGVETRFQARIVRANVHSALLSSYTWSSTSINRTLEAVSGLEFVPPRAGDAISLLTISPSHREVIPLVINKFGIKINASIQSRPCLL
jgi:hypothetical protein